jgi:hypothetical protein
MWPYASNDGSGEYLSGKASSLEEALRAMRALKLERPERYVHADCTYYTLVARRADSAIGFVVVPSFPVDGDYDPPDDAVPYSAEEVLVLESIDELLVAVDCDCESCGQKTHGFFANRTPLRGRYFACLTCQRWSEIDPRVAAIGPRSRRSPLAD